MDLENIERIAVSVRRHIDIQIANSQSIGPELGRFPFLSCEVSSDILGLYFQLKGVESVVKCIGKRCLPKESATQIHTWLLINGKMIVDITADQFRDCDSEIIAGEVSVFHSTFSNIVWRDVSVENLKRPGGMHYDNFYRAVITSLEVGQ